MAFVSNTVHVQLHSEEQICIQDHHNKLFHLEASIPALAPTEPIYNTANCHIQSSTSQQKLNKFELKQSRFSFQRRPEVPMHPKRRPELRGKASAR